MSNTDHDQVILVDQHDNEIGHIDKIQAHQQGILHRAFSIFIFHINNDEISVLLQQRASNKYHSSGLWSNTCCSHPRPGETTPDAAIRRLHEEMGVNCTLTLAGSFIYHADLDNGLQEHEYDHVYIGITNDKTFQVNPTEADKAAWVTLDTLDETIHSNQKMYTHWFAEAYQLAKSKLLSTI